MIFSTTLVGVGNREQFTSLIALSNGRHFLKGLIEKFGGLLAAFRVKIVALAATNTDLIVSGAKSDPGPGGHPWWRHHSVL